MIYIDTSVIVAALTREGTTQRVQQWIEARPEGELVISPWVVTEVSSALSVKVRTGALSIENRAEIMATWAELQSEIFVSVLVAGNHFDVAARFADQHDLGLRAGDALHLAIASSAGHRLATLDKIMAEAAPKLGVPVVTV
ncbi:type II toxin-antitoxin system VapC family toxin [Hankyongella ginsenosidimutans]|uniref:Ribonuclease VapC n=1 Tax=Hankyongella ginsenosidimutans TaxID=1763828 RepID=A0A4D7C253_9SPHN|nr:type II toxin-antitoxin system VapC family toxin [Hankyongella ginsenosidimutans]QCI79784.1 type II toxin-antitoxin system VapC family toxin [Hankyongella ginsenosidimutans]